MKAFLALMPFLLALPAVGQPILSLPLPGDAQVMAVNHSCSDGIARRVSYVTTGRNSLAIFEGVEGPSIFVQVVAASGARYVAAMQEWWVKGGEATLRDATKGEGATITCQAQG
ncbi:MliC family protein [Paracoccus rhizosphaerae]|uniref:MliC family protein n=1 Tax=Paracoccus rhizosphaerae TaxID=1133347 RepID=A0ABV6CJJ0_9RHOB|nr:MliC family protein [Paracoccus rhizosphaerae]